MADQPRIYSIKELNRYIRMKLESDGLLCDIWLRGEISNYTHHSSGHMYFTLKDKDSRLKCIMFASHNQKLPFIPREGTKVMARGNVSVYERDGAYQFYVTQMQPDGIGSLYLAFEQLKTKLESEGLFDPSRKRPLPRFPKAIGVVTSPTGAAVRDVLITLQRRFPNVNVTLVPVLVQGPQAAPAIVKAIETLNRLNEVDVLIVGRGGGSLEELWAFNEEIVARSIAASLIPVISAVGHETDYTIADFVADLRAATPTAAAELAVPHIAELHQELSHLKRRLRQALQNNVRIRKERLQRILRSPLFMHPRRYLLEQAERLDRLNEALRVRISRYAERNRDRLLRLKVGLAGGHPGAKAQYAAKRRDNASRRLEAAMTGIFKEQQHRLGGSMRQLDALSPLKVMARGYSLAYDEAEQRLIRSICDVQPGELIKLRLADGRLDCHVWSMKGEDEPSGTS
ncbi:exodeoxyribonuclease VII large subunit [Paenibacillus darwinianus]|uniref:Exodeoxyribonuclease 7 large subunit n=1 Tax=Paenibacillus darwinianus TaxID=1380763 RepID=A0A9W5RZ77_9BACL|nr:exodeoxyribonuclease VII large subunit [Paenibacillus darwinianus]EXX86614.1 exodeoxyribonuclease VII large subunit [Paenibacillus darwinianus]EXX91512.1 exodeoxyribonuclease VII large subunit [Paenibacillus darwinianus]EXX91863.1 exodeoxyribonuclease VII large subunit [Paenibacillus darwinianus]